MPRSSLEFYALPPEPSPEPSWLSAASAASAASGVSGAFLPPLFPVFPRFPPVTGGIGGFTSASSTFLSAPPIIIQTIFF